MSFLGKVRNKIEEMSHGFNPGWKRVTGYVTSFKWNSDTLHNQETVFMFKSTIAFTHFGFELRERLKDYTNIVLCLRPDLCEDPNQYIIIPPGFANYFRVGDRITVWYSETGKNKYCWGTMVSLAEFEDEPVSGVHDLTPNDQRKHWLKQQKRGKLPIGETYLDTRPGNKEAQILHLTRTCPGTGDGTIVVAGPGVGKSTFIRNLISQIRRDKRYKVIYIATERDEDMNKFIAMLDPSIHLEIFASSEVTDANQKLFIIEQGLNRAMRLAEHGTEEEPVHVVIVIDSITKGVKGPLDELPSPVTGLGIGSGGTSPLFKAVLTMIMGLRGNYGFASISNMLVVLNEGDSGAQNLITTAQGISTVHIYKVAGLAIFPKISFEDTEEGRAKIHYLESLARWQDDWDDPAFIRGADIIRTGPMGICPRAHYDHYRTEAERMNPGRVNEYSVWAAAAKEAAGFYKMLVEAVEKGLSDKEIFRMFNYDYVPSRPAPVYAPQRKARPSVELVPATVHTPQPQSRRRPQVALVAA